MIWVLDASVAIRWFLRNEAHSNAEKVLHALIGAPQKFAVPELFCFEMYSVMNRLLKNGSETFIRGLIPLLLNGMLRYPMTESLARNAKKYIDLGLTGYDACYVALAKDLGSRWLTFDAKAHHVLKGLKVSILLSRQLPGDFP